MPIHLLTGPANSGKANVLLGEARACAARGELPLLIVPTRADQSRYRRELAEAGTVMGVRVERFDGLLAEAVVRARSAAAAIGSLTRERLIAREVGAGPGLAAALARALAELEAQRIAPARLRGALQAWAKADERSEQLALFGDGEGDGVGTAGARSTLEWVCEVYERYRQTLRAMRVRDRELRACAALDALRREPAAWGGTPVLVYGFDDLTELQLDSIETLGAVVDAPVTVSLAYEPARAVFAGRAATFQRLAPLAAAHTSLPARADYYASCSRVALHHLERSLLAEAPERVAPGGAVRLMAAGTPRAELELVAGEVRALLDAGIAAEQVAIVHRSPRSVAALLGEALSAHGVPHAIRDRAALVDTAIGRALIGALRCALGAGELGDLLAWLRCPGVLDHPGLADRLEARALRAGASSSERARAIWEAERWPLERIDRLSQAARTSPARLAEALTAELERLFAAPRRGGAALLGSHELQEAAALAAARRALEELAELSRLAPQGVEAAETLEVLERLKFAVGEGPGCGRVAVVDPLGLRARRVRMLFVCGMQEGVFPAPPAPSLIDEQERRALARASGLRLRAPTDQLAAERYLLYALLSRPEERLTISWHAAAEDGTPLARSLFVDDVCDLYDSSLSVSVAAPAARSAATETVSAPAAGGAEASGCAEQPIAPLRDERVLAELRERRVWSASSLELWASCPVRWFVERLLGGEELGPASEPLARGSLAHAALKLVLERLREQTGSARLTASSLAPAKQQLREALDGLLEEHLLSVAPERVDAARRRLLRDLERYLEHAAEQSSPLEPTYLEWEFGFEDREPPCLPALELGDGLFVRGRIDRIDIGADGEAVVYDYKGRVAPPSARWLREDAWQVALYMKAAQDLLGVRPVGGFYQPLAGRELAARGVLDADAGIELHCVRTDRVDHDELERLLGDCLSAARAAALEARAGALQPRPGTCAYGGGCSYPTICRCER